MPSYYDRHRDYLLDYAKSYRDANKDFIKIKRQIKRREIECEYIIRSSENGYIIKKYNGIIYND